VKFISATPSVTCSDSEGSIPGDPANDGSVLVIRPGTGYRRVKRRLEGRS
jgi:hypothetical protein